MTHYGPSGAGEARRTLSADHDSGAVFRVPGTFFNSGRSSRRLSWHRSSSSEVWLFLRLIRGCARCSPRLVSSSRRRSSWIARPGARADSASSRWRRPRRPTPLVGAGASVQVAAFSTPSDPRWRWRIVNYAGELVEESRDTFPSIAGALEQGEKRLRALDVVDTSV